MKKLLARIRMLLRNRKLRRFWTRCISTVAAVVVFATTYALVLPAITMESEAACGKQAHQHIDSCYEKRLICQLQESDDHHHTESCYEKVLVCGIEPHIHSKECYKEDSSAVAATGQTSAGAQILETAGAENWSGEDAYGSAAEAAGTSVVAADAHAELDSESMDEAALFENGEDPAGESGADFAEGASGASESDLAKNTTDGSGADFEENLAGGSETDLTEKPDNDPGTDFAEGASDGAETAFEEGGSDESGTDFAEDGSEESATDFAEGTSGGFEADFAEDTAGGTGTDNAGATTDDSAADGTQAPAEDPAVDPAQNTPAGQEDSAAAGTTDVLPEELANAEESLSDGYVPQLEELCFPALLTEETGFYYYHIGEKDEIPGTSADITEWKKVNDDTQLAPTDLVKAWLSYTIPAGALNETNQIARYRLPANLHLTDDQILAINSAENGIALQADRSTEDGENEYLKYLGAESIEGTRTPDQDLIEGTQEYISAAVKAENIYENIYENTFDENGNYVAPDGSIASDQGACIGQDLIFIFSPYTIEKNQITYDKKGKPVTKGEAVRGWFAMDFNMEQIDWAEKETDLDNSTIEKSADVIFAAADEEQKIEEISETLNLTEKDPAIADTESENDKAPENAASGEQNDKADEEAKDASEHETADSNDKNDSEEERTSAPDEETAESEDQTKTSDEAESEDDEEESDGTLPAEDEKVTYKAGTLTAEGDSYKVTLDYTENAGIPENAFLSVREITAETDPEAYESCLETARQQVKSSEQTEKQKVDDKASRFFDIEILVEKTGEDGSPVQEKIEPSAPVNVNIQLMEAPVPTTAPESAEGNAPAQPADPTILHFAKDGVEQLEATMNTPQPQDGTVSEDNSVSDAPAAEIRFEAESFSIYGVVYTVDFEYDGYMISIPGESSILLSRLIQELELDDKNSGQLLDIDNISAVKFSNEQLVRVTRVAESITADAMLSEMDEEGIETWIADGVVVRTDDKSDEEVLKEADSLDQIDNEEIVQGGDWILTALQAFHSEETLTIEMNDGTRYVISVTDLDTNQNGQKPTVVTDTVDTVKEGIKITMFDYGPEKLDNVNNTYNSVDNSGINKGHELKFYSYGTNGNTINNFTGGAYAMQGVVQSKLGDDGYPVVNNGKETLAYLFDENMAVNGKTVVSTNANHLFRRLPNEGMELFYDSNQNYAYLNGDNFIVYSDTYLEEGADYENPFRIGFYPYNDYDNRYQCIHGNNFNWGCKGSKDWRVRDQVGHYNHHFGMKVEGNFYMTDDKMITNETTNQKEEMLFKFSGDDDMWVFIDGVLVLDIGGIHNPVDGTINFTTGQVNVSAAKTANGGSSYALGTSTTIADAFAKAGKTWDDSPLSHHDIKIFYMERGGMYSNLAMTMNLPTFPHTKEVVLTKKSMDKSESLAGATFKLFSDVACTKEIKDKETGEAITIVSSGEASTLGEIRISNLIPGQTYYFKETTSPGGYKLFGGIFKISVPANDHDPAVVYLTENGEAVGNAITEILNTPDAYGSFDFFKVEENSGTKLSGAQFTLYTDADCQTIAQDRNHQNLVSALTGTDGKVSFSNIPAGATYYLKETKEPDNYFPSSDVYRVVVSEDGNTTSVYKGNNTSPLFTTSSPEADRKIENKPKADKTSVSVEKIWSDGAENHTNDKVTVQLYETTEDVRVSGGKIDLTVTADQWVDHENPSSTADAPTSGGSISYKIQRKVGEEGTWNDTSYAGTLSPGTAPAWTITHNNLPEMEDGEHIRYQVVITGTDGNVVKSAEVYGNNLVSETDGTITIKGQVSTQTGPATAASVSVTGVAGMHGDDWEIKLSNLKIWYFNGYNYEMKDTWHAGEIVLNKSNNSINVSLPSQIMVNGSVVDKSKVRYGFMLIGSNLQDGLYMQTTPAHIPNNSNTSQSVYHMSGNGGNFEFQIPSDAPNINISFTGTDPGALNIDLTRPSLASKISPVRMMGIARDPVSSGIAQGETSTVYADENKHGDSVTLQNGKWTHTWDGLVKTESATDQDGYTVTRTHRYYVKEISVDLGDGTAEDTVQAEYSYIYNVDGDPDSGIKKVIIKNTVPPKTSLSVTKEWKEADGKTPYEPEAGERTITFAVYRKVGEESSPYRENLTITYDTGTKTWSTKIIDNLPTKIKVGNELKDVSYYVVETSPEASENLITYYKTPDGKTYPDASDAAGASSETIVNINSRKEIRITKAWYYRNGTSEKLVEEPPVKGIWFKLGKIDKTTGAASEFYSVSGTDLPETSQGPDVTPATSTDAIRGGTIFKLSCIKTEENVPNEYGDGTHKVVSWNWESLTFKNLPTDAYYYIVETAEDGTPLISDSEHENMLITYVDENGKLINTDTPINASIPGNYTIKNSERRTSLYAEKIWNAANKDNLAGNEPVWCTLLRVQTDGNGNYDADTLEETPGIGRFNLRESDGWTRYFNNIQISPTGQKEGETYKYYQYFAVELGLLKSASTVPDNEKQYEMFKNLFVEYQTKGSGTGTAADDSDKRTAFAAYGLGVDDTLTSRDTTTVPDWISANKVAIVNWLNTNNDKLRIRTWNPKYDGTGTLGIFNSTEEYVQQPINIVKEWMKADGTALDQDKINSINAEASETQDKYTVEIQLMQRARNLKINSSDSTAAIAGPCDTKYGSTVLLAKDEVIMQSDLFHVKKEGTGPATYWKFSIPPTYVNEDEITVNQLPSKGPFVWNGTTYQADFEYYISEYRVYNGKGEDRTPHWTAACVISGTSGSANYKLTLENYETTDLTVHKTWDEVPAENRDYVDENVKAVLYKVYRIPDGETDETKKEDITESIGANYEAYDLTSRQIYETSRTVKIAGGQEVEVDPSTEPAEGEERKTYYEDYIRVDQPKAAQEGQTASWWNGNSAKDVYLKINNLDTHIRDYVTYGSKDDWKKYKYWIVEQEYLDGEGKEHPISELLHGNSAAYPKYQSSTSGTAEDAPNFGTDKPTTCTKIELGAANASHLGAINTIRGTKVHLLKDDVTDSDKKLSGVKFILTRKNSKGKFVLFDYAADVDGTAVTIDKDNVDGQFEITDAAKGINITGLMPGIYKLQEKKAPDGYNILGTAMMFEVKADGTIKKLSPAGTDTNAGSESGSSGGDNSGEGSSGGENAGSDNSGEGSSVEENAGSDNSGEGNSGGENAGGNSSAADSTEEDSDDENQTDPDERYVVEPDTASTSQKAVNMTVHNTPGAELPSTGGPGTRPLYILGAMLAAVALALLAKRRKV